jgi:hypothetical protein
MLETPNLPAEAGDHGGRLANMGLRRRTQNPRGNAVSQHEAAIEALRGLLSEPRADPEQRKAWLKVLGDAKKPKTKEDAVSVLHKALATSFNKNRDAEGYSDEDVCRELKKHSNLQYLLAQGVYQRTILHVLLDPNTYVGDDNDEDEDEGEFNFARLKPLIRFLLGLQPALPKVTGSSTTISDATPLFFVLQSGPAKFDEAGGYEADGEGNCDSDAEEGCSLDATAKAEILQFLCSEPPDGLGSADAVRSLALVATSSAAESSAARHAVHAAIERNFLIPQAIAEKLSGIKVPFAAPGTDRAVDTPCLEIPDRRGRTCLHLALTGPFSRNKIAWAKALAKLQPSLLKATYRYTPTTTESNGMPGPLDVTPLQHLALGRNSSSKAAHKDKANVKSLGVEEMHKELDDMEELLKCRCLEVFDNDTCKDIMYTRENGEPYAGSNRMLKKNSSIERADAETGH